MSHPLFLFALTEFVISLSPGPAVLLVIQETMKNGTRAGLFTILGIISTNIFYFGLSATGLATLIIGLPGAFLALKVIGSLYLLYLAFDLGKAALIPDKITEAEKTDTHQASKRMSGFKGHSFFKGFLVQSANIKNITYFLAIIPQFIDPSQDPIMQFVMIGIISVLVEIPVLLAYLIATSRFMDVMNQEKVKRIIDGISCLLLIIIAASVALGPTEI